MRLLRKALSGLDHGYLVSLAICLLALWPFLSRPDLPQETDAELHIFRLAELSLLVREGEFYSRWAPNFYYGYGYPIFNYYAPLTYYLGLSVELLPRLNAVDAVKALFMLGLAAAAVGMYGFVRDLWGRAAGYVAAAAYVYAPYVHYVDPHARGDLAEAFSFGVFPLALWATERLRRRPGPWRWLATVTLVAAVILTHNLMAIVFFALLLAWALWHVALWLAAGNRREKIGEVGWPLCLAALAAGVGAAAFFWLPVWMEQEAVNLSRLIGGGSHFDFRNHFLSLGELFGRSRLLDWGASEAAFVFNLGLAQWLLGGLGALWLLARPTPERRSGLFFALASAALLCMMAPAAVVVWERLPLLPFLQFPWRLLGPAAATLAVLAGAAVAGALEMTGSRLAVQRWLPAGLVAAILLLALPLAQPAPWPADFGEVSPRRLLQIELAGRWLGTTSTADFLPATVDMTPQPVAAVAVALQNGVIPERVNRASLPAATTVESEILSSIHYRYRVDGPADFPLRLFLFDFPGWTVTIDDRPAVTEIGRPEGFLVIPTPAGRHVVEVRFGGTPARRLATTLSLLAVGVTLVMAAILANHARVQPAPAGERTRARNRAGTAVVAASLAITIAHGLLLEPAGLLRQDSSGNQALPAQHDTWADFQGQIALIGYDSPQRPLRPGQSADITLYWKAQRPVEINYQVFVHLLDPAGQLAAQSDKLNPGEFPTRHWPTDRYVRDHHVIEVPADAAPGDYRLSVGLWVAAEGWRLPLVDAAGVQIGDNHLLTPLLELRP